MDKYYKNISDQSNPSACFVCAIKENLFILSEKLEEVDVFLKLFKLETSPSQEIKRYFCAVCFERFKEICQFIYVTQRKRNSKDHNINDVCKVCFQSEKLISFPPHLLDVFRSIFYGEAIEIKEELLQDDEDDIFDETESLFKNEDASVKFENNNNFDVKTEEIQIEDYHLHPVLKCEVEDEGVQCNYDEIIPLKCSVCGRSFKTTRDLVNHLKQRLRCRYQVPFVAQYWKSFVQKVAKPFKCLVCLKCK
ncbi:unnamed protein product [Diabrotica balteata]|uniref:C2H2-type domain-containing protein n=1 Tax=Diabrotica balteata TaxID=107213 RepID=A0A9N9T557_DIABA|nr:unnamed protein product [Diabrotica balteata]